MVSRIIVFILYKHNRLFLVRMIVNLRISILKTEKKITTFWVYSWWPRASCTARRGQQGALRAQGAAEQGFLKRILQD